MKFDRKIFWLSAQLVLAHQVINIEDEAQNYILKAQIERKYMITPQDQAIFTISMPPAEFHNEYSCVSKYVIAFSCLCFILGLFFALISQFVLK